MMTVISLLLLTSLLPNLTFTARVNVGIVNGQEAKPHSRPYMVSLQEDKEHVCGGFLISDKFVLSAAHCWNGNEILTVVVGAHNLTNKNERSVRIGVKSYHKHPDYCSNSHLNDIMLLRLKKKVKQIKTVNMISLIKNKKDIESGTNCSVAGWGRLQTNGSASDCLMEATVKIKNNTECEGRWQGIYSVSKMMCAYSRGGSCDGDSGGPLVCGVTAVGVTSFGYGLRCNALIKPNVYTKISAYIPWIHQIIRNVK